MVKTKDKMKTELALPLTVGKNERYVRDAKAEIICRAVGDDEAAEIVRMVNGCADLHLACELVEAALANPAPENDKRQRRTMRNILRVASGLKPIH